MCLHLYGTEKKCLGRSIQNYTSVYLRNEVRRGRVKDLEYILLTLLGHFPTFTFRQKKGNICQTVLKIQQG